MIINTQCRHPDYGHVNFNRITSRQYDITKAYNDIYKVMRDNPNDSDLGAAVRKILSNTPNEEKKKTRKQRQPKN